MLTIDYAPAEILPGARISHHGHTLTVREVLYRRGRGLELHTTRDDGYHGPIVYPHPDEAVSVLYMPPCHDDGLPVWDTRDYPHARTV